MKNLKIIMKEMGCKVMSLTTIPIFKATQGRIYFGGINGFNYFTPQDIKFNNTPPKTLITDIKWLNDGIFEDF